MVITPSSVARALIRLLEKGTTPEQASAKLFEWLTAYDAVGRLPEIRKCLEVASRSLAGSRVVEIIVARSTDLSESVLDQLQGKYVDEQWSDYRIIVDADIIGGFIVKKGGIVFNNSVQSHLAILSRDILSVSAY